MMGLLVKHMYEVKIYWVEHGAEVKRVLAINSFQAKSKVVSESENTGMYDNEKSTAKLIKNNVAVQRAAD